MEHVSYKQDLHTDGTLDVDLEVRPVTMDSGAVHSQPYTHVQPLPWMLLASRSVKVHVVNPLTWVMSQ